jgi:hypothetical protein
MTRVSLALLNNIPSTEQYLGLPSATFIIVRALPRPNSKDVTPLPMEIDTTPLQKKNAICPIDVTLFGIVIDVRPVQKANAPCSIDVTLLPMVTDVRPAQCEKAQLPIVVTVLGIVYAPSLAGGYKYRISLALLNNMLSTEQYLGLSSLTFMFFKLAQE